MSTTEPLPTIVRVNQNNYQDENQNDKDNEENYPLTCTHEKTAF